MENLFLLSFFFGIPIALLIWWDKRKPEWKNKKFLDTSGFFDLKIFGWKINPWAVVIFGVFIYLIGGNLGSALQPIGLVLLIIGGMKIILDLIRKK